MTLRMSIKPGARCTAVRDSIHSLSAGRCERGSLIAGQYWASRRERRRRVPPVGFMGNAAELTHHCPRGV